MTSAPGPVTRVSAGVVAYSDADRLESAVRSIFAQELPPGAEWAGMTLVVSPSPDGTVEVARRLAAEDARIHLSVEDRRRGKSAALREILVRAEGDVVLVMNGDARADRLALAHLLSAARQVPRPFAVMARPVPEAAPSTPFDRAVALLWDVHDDFHRETLGNGTGSHLSDELLLVSLDPPPILEEGIINDGAYLGEQILSRGGSLAYAREAVVGISTARSLREHLVQRRRIHLGHRQLSQMTHAPPTTLLHWGARHPKEAVRLLWKRVRGHPHGVSAFLLLAMSELLAGVVASWAMIRGDPPPVLWERVRVGLGGSPVPVEDSAAG